MNKSLKPSFKLPEVYNGLNPNNKGIRNVTLFDISRLGITLGLTLKDIFICYSVVQTTLIWGAQVKLNTKLQWDKRANKNMSAEKVFQQTETHSIMAKILSNSSCSKCIMSLLNIFKAINKDFYGITDMERASNEGITLAMTMDLNNLMAQKGSGSTKTLVTDPESRLDWLKAKNSSIRSTWISRPTYSGAELASGNASVKTATAENVIDSSIITFQTVVNNIEGATENDIPTKEDIKNKFSEIWSDLNLPKYIDDSLHGTCSQIPTESFLNIKRNSKLSAPVRNTPLPDIIDKLKNSKKS